MRFKKCFYYFRMSDYMTIMSFIKVKGILCAENYDVILKTYPKWKVPCNWICRCGGRCYKTK